MTQSATIEPESRLEKDPHLMPGQIADMAGTAAERISDLVSETPLYTSEALSQGQVQSELKDETTQPGGSFKDRGSGNFVAYYTENGEVFFVTTSAGNHGRGVARAAMELGASAEIVLPKSASAEKRRGISSTGARLTIFGDSFDEALEYGIALAKDSGGRFVHPYADPLVIAGQATIGLELLRQTPDMTHVVLPVGGGGMLAGVASVIKEHKENVEVVAVQVEGNSAFVDSLEAGRPLQGQPVDPKLEGIAVGSVHPLNFDMARLLVDRTVVVDQKTLYQTIRDLYAETGKLLETAGAVSPAGAKLLAGTALRGVDARVVAIASGANAPKGLAEEVDKLSRR